MPDRCNRVWCCDGASMDKCSANPSELYTTKSELYISWTLKSMWTSLGLQWLRIHLAMQGAWGWSVVRPLRSHVPTRTTRPVHWEWRIHALQWKLRDTMKTQCAVTQTRCRQKYRYTYICVHIYHTWCPGNQDGMQALTNETNCITSKITSLKGEGKKGIDKNNFGKYVLTGYNKATKRRTVHKHCTLVDKVTPHSSIGEQLWKYFTHITGLNK